MQETKDVTTEIKDKELLEFFGSVCGEEFEKFLRDSDAVDGKPTKETILMLGVFCFNGDTVASYLEKKLEINQGVKAGWIRIHLDAPSLAR